MNRDNFEELEEITESIQQLLYHAETEFAEYEQEQTRQTEIDALAQQLRSEIDQLIEQILPVLAKYQSIGLQTPTFQELQQHLKNLQQMAESVNQIAAIEIDDRIWQEQAALMKRQESEALQEYRQQIYQDILGQIQSAPDFFAATDLALLVKHYADDLIEIDTLQSVVERLIERINELDQVERPTPVAFLRGTHRATLNFIAEKALQNRQGSNCASMPLPQIKRTVKAPRSKGGGELTGKVIIFGGHSRLVAALKEKLPHVDLTTTTPQDGNGQVENAIQQVVFADLVLIMTAYISHNVGDRAKQACKDKGKTPLLINTTGLTRCLEVIKGTLLAKDLAKKFQKSL
jgi:hypothetical protein